MKLGEALTRRAAQAQKLGDLRNRIEANVLVQEGEKPGEDPNKLIGEFKLLSEQHSELVNRIIFTNARTKVNEDKTILDMLTDRDHLARVKNTLLQAAQSASPRNNFRYSASEIKQVPVIDIEETQNEIEKVIQEGRDLDVKLQEINWSTDLI